MPRLSTSLISSNFLPAALSVLLLLQLLVALLLVREYAPIEDERPDAPLVAVPPEEVDRIQVQGAEGGRATLQRGADGWRLPDYHGAPAAGERVDRLLTRLGVVGWGHPIATTAGALPRFKVGDQAFERRIRLFAGDTLRTTLYLGDSAGPRQAYARTAADEAVYSVDLAAYEVPADPEGWLDSAMLALPADSIRALQLPGGVRLTRDGQGWTAEGLDTGESERFDPAAAQTLAMRLDGLLIERLVGRGLPEAMSAADPVLTLGARTDKDRKLTWELWRREGGEGEPEPRFLVRRSDRPWVGELADWRAEPLIDAARREALLRSSAGHPDGVEADDPADEGQLEGGALH